MSVQLMQVT